MHQQDTTLRNNQSGLVSFIVAAIIMSVLSLITIGFARIMQKEQREALDRQLSTQAFYAAESGVNDVARLAANTPGGLAEINNCSTSANFESTNTIGYTCVLYRPRTDRITINAPVSNSALTLLKSANNPLNSANISWQALDATWGAPATTNFTPVGSWGSRISVVRITVYPVQRAVGFQRNGANGLNNLARTYFLYPSNATDPFDLGTTTDGSIVRAACSGTNYRCNITLTGLAGANYDYYVRVRSIYNESLMAFRGNSAIGVEELADAQATIDATGKANDLKRRVQVKKSLVPQYDWPEAAIETTADLCKLLQVGNGIAATNTLCGDVADPNGIN